MKARLDKGEKVTKDNFDDHWDKLGKEGRKVCTAVLSYLIYLTQFQEAEAKARADNATVKKAKKAKKVCPPHHLLDSLHTIFTLSHLPQTRK